jgi:hypothetical protein
MFPSPFLTEYIAPLWLRVHLTKILKSALSLSAVLGWDAGRPPCVKMPDKHQCIIDIVINAGIRKGKLIYLISAIPRIEIFYESSNKTRAAKTIATNLILLFIVPSLILWFFLFGSPEAAILPTFFDNTPRGFSALPPARRKCGAKINRAFLAGDSRDHPSYRDDPQVG